MAEQSLKDKTAKGLFWGGVSNGVQQLLGMLFGIYLARILNAEDYGLVGMLAIFTGIAGSIINSGFTVALTNKVDATHKEYNAVFWFTFFVGLFIYILLYFCAPLISSFYGRSELTSLSRVLFLSFFFSGIASVPYTVMFKRLMVKEQAKIDVFSLLLSGIIGVFLAMKGMAYWALAIQSMVYISVNSLLKCIVSPWRPTFEFDFRPLKDMFSFSVKLFFTNVFTQINNNVFSVLLGRLYNAAQVGYYTQGYKWMSMGNTFLSGMINSVAQPVLVEVREDRERQLHVFRKMARFAAFVSFPAMLGLAFVAPEFILVTIGEKWMPSVPILQILCFLGAIYPIWILYTQILISHGKSDLYLYGNMCQGIVQLVLLCCMAGYGIKWMVITYVVTYFIFLFFWHYWVYRIIHMKIVYLAKDVLPYLLITVGVFVLVSFLIRFFSNNYTLLFLKIVLSIFLYVSILWFSRSVVFRDCVYLLIKKKINDNRDLS